MYKHEYNITTPGALQCHLYVCDSFQFSRIRTHFVRRAIFGMQTHQGLDLVFYAVVFCRVAINLANLANFIVVVLKIFVLLGLSVNDLAILVSSCLSTSQIIKTSKHQSFKSIKTSKLQKHQNIKASKASKLQKHQNIKASKHQSFKALKHQSFKHIKTSKLQKR